MYDKKKYLLTLPLKQTAALIFDNKIFLFNFQRIEDSLDLCTPSAICFICLETTRGSNSITTRVMDANTFFSPWKLHSEDNKILI